MHLFPREPEIGPDEGFAAGKDIFGRKSFGDQLTRLVRALEDPSVLLLDAQWGTGKTVFVKMWRGELKKAGIPSIYFDAFANDYQKDAFLAVASQIVAEANSLKPRSKQTIDKFTAKAVQVAKVLGRASLRLGIHAATAGLVDGKNLEIVTTDIAKAAGDEAVNVIDEEVKALLESYNSDQKALDNFRMSLTELATSLSRPKESEKKDSDSEADGKDCSLPLVFIIDELDRCRPSFALEILEKIKHFFSVPNVIFLLVGSLPQLEASVRFIYGDIDARMYLEKFYHLRVLFPAGKLDRPDIGVGTYLRHLGGNENINQIIERFSHTRPLSLRTLERIVTYSKITTAGMKENSFFRPQIIAVLCIMKVMEPSLYALAREGKLTFAQADDLMRFADWRDQRDHEKRDPVGSDTEGWWRFALGELKDEQEKAFYVQSMRAYYMRVEPFSFMITHFCELMDGFALPATPLVD